MLAGLHITFKPLDVFDEIVTADVLCTLISKRELFSCVGETSESGLVLQFYRKLDRAGLEE